MLRIYRSVGLITVLWVGPALTTTISFAIFFSFNRTLPIRMRIRDISVGDQELSSHPNWSLTHVYINKNPLEGIRLLLNNEDVKIMCTKFQLLLIVSWKYVDGLCNTFNIHYYRFLHSDFVEGVHAVLDAVSHHAQGVRADSNTRGDEITRMRSSDPRYCVAERLAP